MTLSFDLLKMGTNQMMSCTFFSAPHGALFLQSVLTSAGPTNASTGVSGVTGASVCTCRAGPSAAADTPRPGAPCAAATAGATASVSGGAAAAGPGMWTEMKSGMNHHVKTRKQWFVKRLYEIDVG